jgi:hypothetical protein
MTTRLLKNALGCLFAAVAGAACISLAGCSDRRTEQLEARVAKLEADVAEVRQTAATIQSAHAADPKRECSRAKVACAEAWDKALPGAEAAMKAAGQHDTGRVYQGWNEPWRLSTVKDAKDACSKGAIKTRDAAKAVKDDPKNEFIAPAKAASEAAFQACKDLEP